MGKIKLKLAKRPMYYVFMAEEALLLFFQIGIEVLYIIRSIRLF